MGVNDLRNILFFDLPIPGSLGIGNHHRPVLAQAEAAAGIHFTDRGTSYVAELKTCYGGNTKVAIREAMGQIIEYNHYPPRLQKERWLLVLDSRPTATDQDYITAIRTKYHLPLGMAWP